MSSTPFGTRAPDSAATGSSHPEGVPHIAASQKPTVRHNKRAEDTGAGCRANAAADLARARVPGGDYMRGRLEHSAAVWIERATLLERLERNFKRRTRTA